MSMYKSDPHCGAAIVPDDDCPLWNAFDNAQPLDVNNSAWNSLDSRNFQSRAYSPYDQDEYHRPSSSSSQLPFLPQPDNDRNGSPMLPRMPSMHDHDNYEHSYFLPTMHSNSTRMRQHEQLQPISTAMSPGYHHQHRQSLHYHHNRHDSSSSRSRDSSPTNSTHSSTRSHRSAATSYDDNITPIATTDPDSAATAANNRRRLPCTVAGCTRRFTNRYTLAVHVEAHRPKPQATFPCTMGCPEQFSRAHDRLRHEVAKHQKVCEWICGDCKRFFSTKKTLGSHKCPVAVGGTRWVT